MTITGLHPEWVKHCETWNASARREALGSAETLRVSLVCGTGEDVHGEREIALLYRLAASPPRDLAELERLWVSEAGSMLTVMDSCATSRTVTFRLVGTTLEKTTVDETTWTDQSIAAEVKKQLRRDCHVGKKQRVERTARIR